MNDYANTFLFGIYPYIAIAVFLVGSLARFETEQYTWKSDSSQFLSKAQLRLASTLFHLGILGILGGHFVGLLTPMPVWHALGVTPAAKQLLAIVAGGIFGLMCLVGLAMLIVASARPVVKTSAYFDWVFTIKACRTNIRRARTAGAQAVSPSALTGERQQKRPL